LAKICGEYLKKGKLIALEGRLQVRKWEDKTGQKRTTTEVIASNVQMLERKFFQASETGAAAAETPEVEIVEPLKTAKKSK
jgi:single-strand DNA-binding protein